MKARSRHALMISVGGGNDVFNSIQLSVVDSDFHFNFSTSNLRQAAEEIFNAIRDDPFALAKDAITTKQSE